MFTGNPSRFVQIEADPVNKDPFGTTVATHDSWKNEHQIEEQHSPSSLAGMDSFVCSTSAPRVRRGRHGFPGSL